MVFGGLVKVVVEGGVWACSVACGIGVLCVAMRTMKWVMLYRMVGDGI